MQPPDLPDELRFLLIYLCEAAKTDLLFHDSETLDEALSSIEESQKAELQDHFPHLNLDYALSSSKVFMEALASRHMAPDLWISPLWLLRTNPETRLDSTIVSDMLIDDLVIRLSRYLHFAPVIIRLGLYLSWLRSESLASDAARLAECICGSNAPLLQKLVQMIGDASAASGELQVVKDRIAPMSPRELAIVLDEAEISDMFETFDPESVAAGSIGQGHFGKLKDGTEVFIKVRRFGVSSLMLEEARIFNMPIDGGFTDSTSPWTGVASNLIKETSFALEVENQRKLKRQWTQNTSINIVDIVSYHPAEDPTVLIMKVAPGTTLGRASIRFPVGLDNAVRVINQLINQFYLNTLFYDAQPTSPDPSGQKLQDDAAEVCGFAPADPHGANEMIHVNDQSAEVTLTIIDTASICTITRSQRNQIIDLFIAVVISDIDGIASVLGIPDDDIVEHTKACMIYRKIINTPEKSTTRDSIILKRIVKLVEATKLLLKRPALDDLLIFGKAQLQLLDTVLQFQHAHAYELEKLKLTIASLTHVMLSNMTRNTRRNRELAKRAVWAFGEGAKRKFAESFTAWEWDADGRDGQKMWPFGT